MSELGRPFLPPDVRRLIETDRTAADPPSHLKRDIAARIDRSLGLGGALLVSPAAVGLDAMPSAPPPAPVPTSLLGWKVVTGAAVAVVVGGAALLSMGSAALPMSRNAEGPSAERHSMAVSPAPPVLGDRAVGPEQGFSSDRVAAAAAAAAAVRVNSGAQRAAPHHRAGPVVAVRAIDTLAAERTVLDVARTALVQHDAAAALASVHSHEQAFPRGQLLEERESMRVQAFALSRDYTSARAARDRFRRHFPRSMFLPVIERALETSP